jgi:RNA polymerase sigma factor (sigma-70 family)
LTRSFVYREVVGQGHNDVTISTLEAVYRERYPRFARVALSILGDQDLAHDAVQEAFARAIRGRDRVRHSASLESWLWRTLVNICTDDHRARQATWSDESSVGSAETPTSGEWSGLREQIATLPERQRLVIFLRHYADLDYDAIGDVLGIKRGTVAATLHAAHAKLRQTLMEVID